MQTEDKRPELDERKPYAKPGIVHELELETRAGSPLGPIPNPLGDEFDS